MGTAGRLSRRVAPPRRETGRESGEGLGAGFGPARRAGALSTMNAYVLMLVLCFVCRELRPLLAVHGGRWANE